LARVLMSRRASMISVLGDCMCESTLYPMVSQLQTRDVIEGWFLTSGPGCPTSAPGNN
jgi:hypothetical protein